jgi:predicted aldo/keto reductase-like oxidoreductase
MIDMQTRRFGRTGHMSTVFVFGAFAVGQVTQKEADVVMELLLEHGVNHIDVAPSYHDAELRLGPWLKRHRDRFFLGCKTELRGKQEAAAELRRSLERLQVDRFDLFQLHAVTTMEQLEQCFAPGGAMEAILDARDEGLTRYVGITSHGMDAPAVELAALDRFDFDSVLFPLNFKLWSDPAYQCDARALLRRAAEQDVGSMVIKSIAKGPWGEQARRYHTWYEPFDTPQTIRPALHFALSQPVTAAISAGDARLLPMLLEAAQGFQPLDAGEQAALVSTADAYGSIFA